MSLTDFLTQKRKEVDEVDRQIVRFLEKRFELSRQIIYQKKEKGMDVYNPDRENEIFKNIMEENRISLKDSSLRAIFERILDESRRTGLE